MAIILDDVFNKIYIKFKLNFYRGLFRRLQDREASLTVTEAFAAEVIYALHEPTIGEFADCLQISQPNATYKVNALMKKGYIKKVHSVIDKREYHLCVTSKFWHYYGINHAYIKTVMQRIRQRFTAEEVQQLENMLKIIADELMIESVEWLNKRE